LQTEWRGKGASRMMLNFFSYYEKPLPAMKNVASEGYCSKKGGGGRSGRKGRGREIRPSDGVWGGREESIIMPSIKSNQRKGKGTILRETRTSLGGEGGGGVHGIKGKTSAAVNLVNLDRQKEDVVLRPQGVQKKKGKRKHNEEEGRGDVLLVLSS